jgi:MFS family permease
MVNAVALANTVWQLSHLVGPAIAGMLIYLYGVGSAFYVGCFGFLVAVILVLLIHVNPATSSSTRRGFLREMLEGVNFIRQNEIIYSLIALSVFNGVFGMSYVTLMPVFARDILEVGSRGFGFLQTSGGAGSVLGALTVAYLSRSGKKGWQMIMGAFAFGMLLIGFGFSTSYPLSLGLLFLIGWANDLYLTTIGSVLQLHLPDQLRGRVMAIYGLTWSLMPLGGMIAGAVAEFAGAPVAVAICGFLVMAMALAMAKAVPRLRRLE